MKTLWIPLTIAAAMAAAATPTWAQRPVDLGVARGAHVAERDCASCHAVGPSGASPAAEAPTFRALRLRYNPISLEQRLGRLPSSGHPAMPPRSLAGTDVADLVAYIQTLEPAARTP